MKKIFALLFLLLLGGGIWWFWLKPRAETDAEPKVAYKSAPVTVGKIVRTIRSTGTIEPEDLIDVGAQITGQIMAFGTDTEGREVDYCSVVKKGQLLARIDDVTYRAEVTIAKAALATAEAQLASANAEVAQQNARLRQTVRDWERAQKLGVGDALSQKDFDAYQSAYEVAAASLEVGRARVRQGRAAIDQAKARLEKAERNLSYCEIRSTVDGVVIDRRVNLGQTVTASMNTPSLFLVAKDLRRIEIWVPVNEADIGAVKEKMPVRFTVDAFPGKTFEGTVSRIRLNASMSSNVVTYTVEVATTNPDSLLLPYLTANVSFIVDESPDGALTVPQAALYWHPEGVTAVPGTVVYVRDEAGNPKAVPVKAGVSDDARTAVEAESLQPGDEVITGTMTPIEVSQAKAGGSNPFVKLPNYGKDKHRVRR